MPLLLALRFWEQLLVGPVQLFIVRARAKFISATPVHGIALAVRHALRAVAGGVVSVTVTIERRPCIGVFISRTPVAGVTLLTRARIAAAAIGAVVHGVTISPHAAPGFPVRFALSTVIGGTASKSAVIAT